MSLISVLPLLILLIIVCGSGFVGLVFLTLMNIGITFGTYLGTQTIYIPAEVEQSND